ncbi:hypothetical protein KP509_17G003000 [Ceratopteris richardii]|nr:hypothetical protein KP509_17G003000 [Ceratopteris richardii]
MEGTSHTHVPPGFRFHPTDEELINFYLKRKVAEDKFELDHVICEVDLNKLEPWDLHEKCKIDASHQTEWYFFSHKDKKYPTGTRTNRATAAGFWKATGRDKAVHSASERIGMRKTLVFYRGRAPHGKKTDWIMHEYRLEDNDDESKTSEDAWVVCRVFKKRNQIERDTKMRSHIRLSDEDLSEPVLAKSNARTRRRDVNDPPTGAGGLLVCKEEEDEDNSSHIQPRFLQLPQLESPEMAVDAAFKSKLAENRETQAGEDMSLTSGGRSCNGPEESNDNTFFMSEDHFDLLYNSGPIEDNWNVYDSIARYHLDFINLPGDISQSLQSSRSLQALDYPSTSCDVELWNFSR